MSTALDMKLESGFKFNACVWLADLFFSRYGCSKKRRFRSSNREMSVDVDFGYDYEVAL